MKPSLSVLLTLTACLSGCAQSLLNHTAMETRVIEQFADALEEENEPALRRITSTRFEEKALNSDDVLRDLRVMHLPTGKLSVVEVKDVEKGRREVIVKEESGGKYQFQLVNDPKKAHWVVDDVVIRQRKKGTQVTKSTTEVMDLLVTLRQFLEVWESGTREEIFEMASPELTASLQPLPDEWLTALTARIASAYEDGMARKPEANMSEDEAVVKLPAKNGHLLMKIVKSDNGWLVDDVEAHNHREDNHPGSVRRQASAINAVNGFLTAYAAEDHEALELITTEKLYADSLSLANLSLVRLPHPEEVAAQFDIRSYEDLLTVMIPSGREIIRMDLQEESKATANLEGDSHFLVRDVTLYEKSTQRQRALSAVFTAPTRAVLFLRAMRDRDHRMLSQISTEDFSKGTWERATPELLAKLPIPEFHEDGLKLTNSRSFAQTTELEFETASGGVLSCRLTSINGVLKVDDVQYPNDRGQVTSLKTQLNVSVPIVEFATAWQQNNMEQVQKACSSDFNRLVWSHLEEIPQQFPGLAGRLQEPISDTRITQERATIKFQGSKIKMVAQLVMEHGYWVVDEVQSEPTPGEFVGVRQRLRNQIAKKMLSGSYSTKIAENGHEIISPLQVSSPRKPSVDRGFTAEEMPGTVQTAAVNTEQSASNGRVSRAIYHRYPDGDGAELVGDGVRTAVLTRDVTEDAMVGDRPTPVHPAAAGSGVEVFGPQASQIAEELAAAPAPEPSAPFAFGTSLTETESPADPELDSVKTEDGMLYFGPPVQGGGATQTTPSMDMVPKRLLTEHVREPADMPISIN